MKIKLHPIVKIISIIVAIIVIFLMYLRFISTSGFIVKECKVVNKNIGEYHGLKIVHFSDIHYKSSINSDDLKKIVEKINYINPDIVVFTGDIFDKDINYNDNDIKILTDLFTSINATYKKYAISGDNDNKENYKRIIGNSNFVDLNDRYDLIYSKSKKPILITGNVDKASEYMLDENADQTYSILLLHEPDKIKGVNNFDLVLAGHSLNGQIKIPFIGGIRKMAGAETYYDEYYKVNKTDLYISGGLGTNKVNLRYFNKPSINFYRITKK